MKKIISFLCSLFLILPPLLKASPPNVIIRFMTGNDCFNCNRSIEVKGIMIHSTAEPGIMAEDWFDLWNKSYKKGDFERQVCVHCFSDDKNVCQYLP